ncbi:winged helix-turn-helix domain-containing protein [Flavobacterium agricola]|uniref:winged helix-turn-helix domain-containing protein n=1 Tax=Flavobacterium agricola TaxID=2870839 RepID=UPI002938E645|nr:winged helix-turn-helix domain-containing protein [Flavobacterium agricola]
MLEYLLKNKGKICTRKELLENIWNIHFEYDSSVIDVFMNAVRKKLNLNKETNFIKTIRGTGYLIE